LQFTEYPVYVHDTHGESAEIEFALTGFIENADIAIAQEIQIPIINNNLLTPDFSFAIFIVTSPW
jgi:hypothetical protein